VSKVDNPELEVADYAALAAFRFELRRFLAFSEQAAASHGLPAQQHQALLAIAGHTRAQAPTVGLIAEQLLITPSSAVELVSRMVAGGLVVKTTGVEDRRRAELQLTPKSRDLLAKLSRAHLQELEVLKPALKRALGRLDKARPKAVDGA
jgi:DNA-binding MarR family transcriptional regulator